ncbi:TPM domain-containing protein [Neisseria animalis]|uniref:TPM domain-containing protein n=1 Tax=Neisseria animalis TaxID=492 RepID=A0A5P3MNU8_NEIAN|nr:TPM domain-containing protein [Neisseria animalis]QEY23206.1 hypothetical protein D0T90_00675 [Neisseria animalis]ROW31779.1 hypothetical protein CGZ60_08385 [Neisseria animalis]VEE08385.1 Domain of uncharacterised function (DUF477) [Neisseria animalis]
MESNTFKRLWQHWQYPRMRVEKLFPTDVLQRISGEIARSEQNHGGQIRFVVESRYRSSDILAGIEPHTRALQWFGELGVWDTEHNSGVLVYVSFADRVVEIVADRGISRKVPHECWQHICSTMGQAFREGRYTAGLEEGLRQVDALLREHFPHRSQSDNLADDVVLV